MSTAPGLKSKEQCKSSNWVFFMPRLLRVSMLLGHSLASLSIHRTRSRPTRGYGCFGFDGHPASVGGGQKATFCEFEKFTVEYQ